MCVWCWGATGGEAGREGHLTLVESQMSGITEGTQNWIWLHQHPLGKNSAGKGGGLFYSPRFVDQHHGSFSSAFPFLGSEQPPSTTQTHLIKGLHLTTMTVDHDVVLGQTWFVQQRHLSWAEPIRVLPRNWDQGWDRQSFHNSLPCWTQILGWQSWIFCDRAWKKTRNTLCREKKKKAHAQKEAKTRQREILQCSSPWFQFSFEPNCSSDLFLQEL